MRSPLPFPCVPDRPYKILLVQVWTLSFSPIPRLVCLLSFFLSFTLENRESTVLRTCRCPFCQEQEN